jgi:bacterioferritin B
VLQALNTHMGREFAAHLQYLSVAAYFESEGLPELARFFYAQASEEHEHGMKFLHFIVDYGGRASIPALEAPRSGFESAEEAVELALRSEEAVTGHINDLVQLSIERNDHATHAFLQWFVTEQVEEVSTMTELLQVVRRAGEPNLLLVEEYAARKLARGAHGLEPAGSG